MGIVKSMRIKRWHYMIVGCFLVVVFLSVDTASGQGHADHGLVGPVSYTHLTLPTTPYV